MPELVFFRRSEELMRVTLGKGPLTVGREGACDVLVPEPDISRRQLSIERDPEGRYWLTDLSTRGTEVEGRRVSRTELGDGADIGLGRWRAIFHLADSGLSEATTQALPRGNTERLAETSAPAPSGRGRRVPKTGSAQERTLPLFRDRLIVETRGERRELACPNRFVVGSHPECDLALGDPFASARHARIERRGRGYLLSDLHSSNGTFVGATRIFEAEIAPGTSIRIGESVLRILPSDCGQVPESFEGMIGRSEAMRRLFSIIERVAPSSVAIAVFGESGTGKELVARALHARSPRSAAPFVPINCGALSSALVESELFGHEKGAFTSADRARRGAFEEAHRGTLFLDEIGELPLDLQAKLLRALELGEIKRVGASAPLHVDVRIVAATNRDLRADVAAGTFREDLYWRLSALPLQIPPLRARESDVRELIRHFLHAYAPVDRPVTLSRAAEDRLCAHSWPGNVRELKNCLHRTLLLRQGDVVEAGDIAFDHEILGGPPEPRRALRRGDDADDGVVAIAGKSLAQIEEEVFRKCCRRQERRVSAVARELGLSRGTVYRRMERLGIEPHGEVRR